MNLWIRVLWILCKAFFSSASSSASEERVISFRVWWLDCDINGHLTNSRYHSFMDLARLDFFYHTQLWSMNPKKSCFPLLQSVEISFIRPILPGKTLKILTKILGYDQKYCYIQQQFTVEEKLVADARVRAVLCNRYGEILPPQILSDYNIPSTIPESLIQWKHYLTLKTEETLKS